MRRENIIWSKDDCIFCQKAKRELDIRSIPYEERKLGDGWTKEQLLEMVPDAKTVPQIFMWGEYVGGYTDLQTYIENHGMNVG
ncbi:MAG: glutaredoxin [Pelagibacteraceae bacterium]